MAQKLIRNDADAAGFIAQQLQYISPDIIKAVFAAPEWADHLPLESGDNEAVAIMGFDLMKPSGRAEFFTGNGQNLPQVDVVVQRITRPVFDIGIERSLSDTELEQAALAAQIARQIYGQTSPIALDKAKEEAAAQAVAEKHESTAVDGDTAHGLYGVTNYPSLNAYVPPAGGSGSTLWENKTGEEIVADMHGLQSMVITNAVRPEYWPDHLVLPLDKYLVASDPSKKLAYTQETPLSYFQRTNPMGTKLTIGHWRRLNGKGTASSGFSLCYKMDKNVIAYQAPRTYRVNMPPNRAVAGWSWAHTGRTAGVAIKRPFAVGQMDGF